MLSRLALRKTSLIDFPGRVASVLFLPGCNFRCPYCHNAGLVEHRSALPPSVADEASSAASSSAGAQGGEDEFLDLDEVFAFLKRRSGLVTGVVISGGEPLLHDEVPALARRIKALGLAVKLDTNGSFPEGIRETRADYVALDLKTAPSRYDTVAPGVEGAAAKVLESLQVLRSSGRPYEVRVTCAPGIVASADIDAIAAILEPRDEVILQPFRPGGCLDPAFDSLEVPGEAELGEWLARLRISSPGARIRGQGHHRHP